MHYFHIVWLCLYISVLIYFICICEFSWILQQLCFYFEGITYIIWSTSLTQQHRCACSCQQPSSTDKTSVRDFFQIGFHEYIIRYSPLYFHICLRFKFMFYFCVASYHLCVYFILVNRLLSAGITSVSFSSQPATQTWFYTNEKNEYSYSCLSPFRPRFNLL